MKNMLSAIALVVLGAVAVPASAASVSPCSSIDAGLVAVGGRTVGVAGDVSCRRRADDAAPADRYVEPLLCPILEGMGGDYVGLVVIGPDGDVTIAEVYFWDCPP